MMHAWKKKVTAANDKHKLGSAGTQTSVCLMSGTLGCLGVSGWSVKSLIPPLTEGGDSGRGGGHSQDIIIVIC